MGLVFESVLSVSLGYVLGLRWDREFNQRLACMLFLSWPIAILFDSIIIGYDWLKSFMINSFVISFFILGLYIGIVTGEYYRYGGLKNEN